MVLEEEENMLTVCPLEKHMSFKCITNVFAFTLRSKTSLYDIYYLRLVERVVDGITI